MQQRQAILELFSTFAQWRDDGQAKSLNHCFQGWMVDARLQRSMEQVVAQSTANLAETASQQPSAPHDSSRSRQNVAQPLTEDPSQAVSWSLYWYQCWQSGGDRFAHDHLAAYLQEPCYWVAQELTRKLNAYKTTSGHTPLDFFQMAALEVPASLAKFKPEKSPNLKAFVQVFLSYRLRANLRQQRQADFCTAWGLLRKTSRKRLLEVLAAQGLSDNEASPYSLLWLAYKQICQPTQPGAAAKLAEPNEKAWMAIAQFYNDERQKFLPANSSPITVPQAEKQLHQLAQWIRSQNTPRSISLNKPRPSNEGPSEDWQSQLADPAASPIEQLLNSEAMAQRQKMQAQLSQNLIEAVGQLDDIAQKLLHLTYCEGLPQQEITQQMAMSQPTVSRRLKKIKAQLLNGLLQQLAQSPSDSEADAESKPAQPEAKAMNKSLTPDQLKTIQTALEVWLQVYLPELNLFTSG